MNWFSECKKNVQKKSDKIDISFMEWQLQALQGQGRHSEQAYNIANTFWQWTR